MSSLVEELQRDALNGDVDISDLLRKAYVVATKLKLEQFREWCSLELNGYDDFIPGYRRIVGTLRVWNPYNGWIPFMTDDSELVDQLRTHLAPNPIAELQQFASSSTGHLIVRFSPELQYALASGMRSPLEVTLHIGTPSIYKILDAVRNTILDWSLKLEEDGILGEEMSFSPNEKKRASKNSDELQSIVNFNIGTMVNSSLQHDSPGAKQRNQSVRVRRK